MKRTGGSSGSVCCKYATEAASAVPTFDYEHVEGVLSFEHGEVSAEICVTIKSKGRYYGKAS